MSQSKSWLQEEMEDLEKETKKKKKDKNQDMRIFTKCMLFLIPMLIYAVYSSCGIDCPYCGNSIDDIGMSEGASWRCKKCKTYNYSEVKDWQGYYYCSLCGTRMGDE